MATYAGKITAALKVETRKDGKQHFSRDRALFTPKHAFNQLYAWSQIPVCDSVIPVGPKAAELHQRWLRKVKKVRFLNASGLSFTPDEMEDLWDEVLSSVNSGNKVRTPLCSL